MEFRNRRSHSPSSGAGAARGPAQRVLRRVQRGHVQRLLLRESLHCRDTQLTLVRVPSIYSVLVSMMRELILFIGLVPGRAVAPVVGPEVSVVPVDIFVSVMVDPVR